MISKMLFEEQNLENWSSCVSQSGLSVLPLYFSLIFWSSPGCSCILKSQKKKKTHFVTLLVGALKHLPSTGFIPKGSNELVKSKKKNASTSEFLRWLLGGLVS